MNNKENKELEITEENLGLLFQAYFHQDWDAEYLCPCELVRHYILRRSTDAAIALLKSMWIIARSCRSDKQMVDTIIRLDMNVYPQNYGMLPRAYWDDIIDLMKYIGQKEKSEDYGMYVRERGDPLLPPSSAKVEAVNLYPCLYSIICECFVSDCIVDHNKGSALYVKKYFLSQSESKLLEIDEELKRIYYGYGNEEVLGYLLLNDLGLRYNLSYYNMPPRMFVAAIIDILYYQLPMDKRELLDW